MEEKDKDWPELGSHIKELKGIFGEHYLDNLSSGKREAVIAATSLQKFLFNKLAKTEDFTRVVPVKKIFKDMKE